MTLSRQDFYRNSSDSRYGLTCNLCDISYAARIQKKNISDSDFTPLPESLPDEEDTPGCKHAFTKAIFVPGQGYIGPPSTMTEKKSIGQTGSTVKSKFIEVDYIWLQSFL